MIFAKEQKTLMEKIETNISFPSAENSRLPSVSLTEEENYLKTKTKNLYVINASNVAK